jgi:hypothetical protein
MAQLGSNINEGQTRKCRSTSTVAVTSTTEPPGILLEHSDYYAELVDHLVSHSVPHHNPSWSRLLDLPPSS